MCIRDSLESLWADGQVQSLGVIESGEDPAYGAFEIMGLPFTLTDHDRGLVRSAPRIGEHSEEIMREIGYDDVKIEQLLSGDVVKAS